MRHYLYNTVGGSYLLECAKFGEQKIFDCKEWRSNIESSDNLVLPDNQLSKAEIADYIIAIPPGGLGSTYSIIQ
jgi:hypothetical protein